MSSSQHGTHAPVLKAGDNVTCRFGNDFLKAGATYSVEEVFDDENDPDRCQLIGLNVFPGHLWGSWRFIPVKDD